MAALRELPNVGKVLHNNLISVGITTEQELKEVGVEEAFRRIRAIVDPGACLHMLYGLQGAVLGIPDKNLDEPTREKLRAFYKTL